MAQGMVVALFLHWREGDEKDNEDLAGGYGEV